MNKIFAILAFAVLISFPCSAQKDTATNHRHTRIFSIVHIGVDVGCIHYGLKNLNETFQKNGQSTFPENQFIGGINFSIGDIKEVVENFQILRTDIVFRSSTTQNELSSLNECINMQFIAYHKKRLYYFVLPGVGLVQQMLVSTPVSQTSTSFSSLSSGNNGFTINDFLIGPNIAVSLAYMSKIFETFGSNIHLTAGYQYLFNYQGWQSSSGQHIDGLPLMNHNTFYLLLGYTI